MKIYLINPKFPVTFLGLEYTHRMVGRRYASPSLSLLTVAGLTPASFDIEYCDENVEPIRWASDAEVIGLTGMHLQRPRILEIARRFRALGKQIVIGGPSVTACPEWYRPVADVLILGEAERIWPAFLADLAVGRPRSEYAETGQINLRDSPMPRYEFVNPHHYGHMVLQTTRGCPFTCEFCDIIVLYGRTVRTKPVAQVLAELERLLAMGAQRIMFVDDNFVGSRAYVYELLEAIRRMIAGCRRPPVLACQATVNVAKDRALLQLMHEAGMRQMFIGIETPRQASLVETHKYHNAHADLLKAIEMVQSHGIMVMMGMVVGFDHDDPSIFHEQEAFIAAARVSVILPSQLLALPGTPLYTRMQYEGRLRDLRWVEARSDQEPLFHESNILPRQMTSEQLNEGYLAMLEKLFEPKAYTERLLGELERLNRVRSNSRAVFLRPPWVWAGFGWVGLWFLVDSDRWSLLPVFYRVFLRVIRRYRRVADSALMRLVMYRHIFRLIRMWRRTSQALAEAAQARSASLVRGSSASAVPRHTQEPVHVPA